MEKYSWSFNENAERWLEDPQDTIADCIAAARESNEDNREFVYIGINVKFTPEVDADPVLERLVEQASYFAGEVGDDWEAYNHKKQGEIAELSQSLTAAVIAWQAKYGYTPNFYAIENIREHRLDTGGAV